MMFFRKKPLPVPDPGQQVRLRVRRGQWRGKWRAISEPYTNARGEAVIWVAPEWEYQDALQEGHRAIGIPWPAKQMDVVSPLEGPGAPKTASEPTSDTNTPAPDKEPQWRSRWRRMFGV